MHDKTSVVEMPVGALRLLEQWTEAFNQSDVDKIVSLYAKDAVFFGSGTDSIVDQMDGIEEYFRSALLGNKPCTTEMLSYRVRLASDDVVLVVAVDRNTGLKNGSLVGNIGRVTFVMAKQDSEWKIIHFHRSRMPK
ncbi:MAG: SgcJ/EcaC family oxidoreductase [Hyphomicrobiaceae bacterium]